MSIDPRDVRIAELETLLRAALKEIAMLRARVAELEAKLGKNSRNSSRPPSSDGPETTRRRAKPSGKRRGGQPGHQGHERTMLPPDRVADYRPDRCERCASPLSGDDPDPKRWQVFELPRCKPDVTEHRAHALACAGCGAVTAATLPDEAVLHGFGPRLTATLGYLSARMRLSKRQVSEAALDLFGVPISTGAVCNLEQDTSHTLTAPVEEARGTVRQQSVVHLDETGWREDKKRAWLWVAVTPEATVFQVSRSRGGKVAREILGEGFTGRIVTDRWSGYGWVDADRRQLCWAHLIRDLKGMIERDEVGAGIAALVRDEVDKMFEWWKRVRDGTMDRATFQELMKPVRAEVGRLLREASASAAKKTSGMCTEILKLESALWTFVDVEGIEPTNNVAERAIRPAVLWRKGSFGNDSELGSRFTERVLTAVATLRRQRRNVLEYLADACAAVRVGRPAPSLLVGAANP